MRADQQALRAARLRAGLSQADLAALAGTSQATISAYESGRKQPSVGTFRRLLAATGERLVSRRPAYVPSPAHLEANARTLEAVLGLADRLPAEHAPALRYPRLPA